MIFNRMNSFSARALALLVSTAACASPRSVPVAPLPSPAASDSLPNDVKWVRSSAEYRALTREVYAMAGERLPELVHEVPARRWAVILDADETVLDNSEYQRRLAVAHAPFDAKSWTAWVNERAAPAVPGALGFTRLVRSLGGRVAIVTNRSMAECDATRENLRGVGIEADVVLCQPAGEADKNPRFRRVQDGSAAPGLPALTVVEWLGDNIQDFPSLTQSVRADSAVLSQFGKSYFVLPNPMYGSWEHVH
jgi:5'-nucleotidase (lipoprotein e(P4) family)